MERATFAAGCFWGVEEAFRRVKGVETTIVGYTGGSLEDPTYEDVCTGRTGHAEAVQLEFDPSQVSYDDLLEVFWTIHDPTTPNRQGPDIGHQYRSAVFYENDDQEMRAVRSRTNHQNKFARTIVTEILPAGKFYPAEQYHQQYLEKRGLRNCHI